MKLKNLLTSSSNMEPTDDIFNNIFKECNHTHYMIPFDDLDIITRLDLKKHNAIVAGGAALRWYQGFPIEKNDIDLWFNNIKDMEKMKAYCDKNFSLSFQSDNAITYDYMCNTNRYVKIQIIKRTYTDVVNLLNSFDISVCRIAFDGLNWYHGNNFTRDLKNKVLRVDGIKHQEIIKRVMKYWSYGYTPTDELINELISMENISFNFKNSQGGEYENTLFF